MFLSANPDGMIGYTTRNQMWRFDQYLQERRKTRIVIIWLGKFDSLPPATYRKVDDELQARMMPAPLDHRSTSPSKNMGPI